MIIQLLEIRHDQFFERVVRIVPVNEGVVVAIGPEAEFGAHGIERRYGCWVNLLQFSEFSKILNFHAR